MTDRPQTRHRLVGGLDNRAAGHMLVEHVRRVCLADDMPCTVHDERSHTVLGIVDFALKAHAGLSGGARVALSRADVVVIGIVRIVGFLEKPAPEAYILVGIALLTGDRGRRKRPAGPE